MMIISLTRAILLLLAAVEEKAVNFFLENTKERKFGVLFFCLVFQAGEIVNLRKCQWTCNNIELHIF